MLFKSPNPCLHSFNRLGNLMMIWGVDLRGRAVFCSVRAARTVRGELADGLRVACSSRVRRVLVRLYFRSGLILGFRCSWFADGPSFSSGRSGTHADGPPGLRGRSIFLGSVLVVLLSLTDGPWPLAGRSACPLRTVHGTWPDCPHGLCG
jgi:hypothetical protein